MRAFLAHLGLRIAAAAVMIFVVASFTFFLVRAVPGNPVEAKYGALLRAGVPPLVAQRRVALLYDLVPHTSLLTQYGHYLDDLVHFNLGRSISGEGVSVSHLVLAAAPWTLIMVLSGTVVSFALGVTGGVVAAIRRNSWTGSALSLSGSLLHGVPQFVMGILLAYVFTTLWPVLPFGAPYAITVSPGLNPAYIGSLVVHGILPVTAYALSGYGGYLLTMRSSVVTTLGDDYILAAELRGLTPLLRARYVARNALLPLFTVLVLSLGFMFAGAVFIETIFDYPGLGSLLLSSINNRDYPLMSGAFLLITTSVLVCNVIADFLYGVIDPRVRRR